MFNVKTATKDQLDDRARFLANEIEDNEQENQLLQRELNVIYKELDDRSEIVGVVLANTHEEIKLQLKA